MFNNEQSTQQAQENIIEQERRKSIFFWVLTKFPEAYSKYFSPATLRFAAKHLQEIEQLVYARKAKIVRKKEDSHNENQNFFSINARKKKRAWAITALCTSGVGAFLTGVCAAQTSGLGQFTCVFICGLACVGLGWKGLNKFNSNSTEQFKARIERKEEGWNKLETEWLPAVRKFKETLPQ